MRRGHPATDPGPAVAVDGRVVTLLQLQRLLDAYQRDHPDFVAPRPGIRGRRAEPFAPGLPAGWTGPYRHLLDEGPTFDADGQQVTLPQLQRLLDAYLRDHPECLSDEPTAGIPAGWTAPYRHLLDADGDPPTG